MDKIESGAFIQNEGPKQQQDADQKPLDSQINQQRISQVKINDASDLIRLLCPDLGAQASDMERLDNQIKEQGSPERDRDAEDKKIEPNSLRQLEDKEQNQSVRMILPGGKEVLLDINHQALLSNFNKSERKMNDDKSVDSSTPNGDKDIKASKPESKQVSE